MWLFKVDVADCNFFTEKKREKGVKERERESSLQKSQELSANFVRISKNRKYKFIVAILSIQGSIYIDWHRMKGKHTNEIWASWSNGYCNNKQTNNLPPSGEYRCTHTQTHTQPEDKEFHTLLTVHVLKQATWMTLTKCPINGWVTWS